MTKLPRKVLALVLVAAMTADMISSCGNGSKTSATAAPSTGSQVAGGEAAGSQATRNNGAESKVSGEIEAGDSLTIAIPQLHNIFFMPQSATTNDRFRTRPVLESLGHANTEGNYFPWLAEEFITDPGNPMFTVKLRDDVKFHNGSMCDGEVVTWNIQQYIDNGKASEIGASREVKVVDDLTVQIQYDEWANNWGNVTGDIYIRSKEAYEKNGVEWYQTHVAGAGPLILRSFIADNKITYTRNGDYRIEGQLYTDHLEIDVIADTNTMTSVLLNKEVDVAVELKNDAITNAIEQAGPKSVGRKNVNVVNIKHIIWSSKSDKHPMGDLKARQAIVRVIQRDDAAKALSGGLGGSTPLLCTSDSWAYAPDAKFYEYDPGLVRQMLAEAGYPNGLKTTIYTKVVDDDTATVFQAILAQIDIKAEVNVMGSSTLVVIQKGDDTDGFIVNRGASEMDFANNYIRLYFSEGIRNHDIMLRPAESEESLFAARAAKIIEEKRANLQKAAKALAQDYVMITSMAVMCYETLAVSGLEDNGICDMSLKQRAPEAVHWTK